jgi:membrane-bound lytic murein transglycosylase D
MELPYNDIVRKYIDQYTNKQRSSVAYMLGAGNFYVPIFEEVLDKYGLPLELKFLPVIESALNPVAKSKVGATGLWQFMLATGQRYGLEVNSLVDDRCDPIKSSDAAARFLKDLYKIYGDWSLVIAAYNCGPGNVNKAIRRAGGVKDYWQIYPYLPSETRGYVPAFIAANYIMNYYCEHNICPMSTKIPIATDTVVVTRDVHIDQIIAYCNIEKESIKSLNPQYKTNIIPGSSEPRVLRMTQQAILEFTENEDSIYAYKADELIKRRTTVVPKTTGSSTQSSSQKKSSGSKYYKKSYSRRKR